MEDGETKQRRLAAESLRGMFAEVAEGRSLVDELIAERRNEARAEEREDLARRKRMGSSGGPVVAVARGGYALSAMSMVAENLIAEAGRRLAEAAPDARVILFGSHARGEAGQ
jgi:hypothetical protein